MPSIDFPQLVGLVDTLAESIATSAWRPAIIVGLPPGGWVVAALLAQRLGVTRLLSVGLCENGSDIDCLPHPLPSSGTVLIVEDCVGDGEALAKAEQAFQTAGTQVRTAALFTLRETDLTPTYSVGVLESPPHLPWHEPLPPEPEVPRSHELYEAMLDKFY